MQPVFGGQLPKDDMALCAALLAEADFFGVEALLQHVKVRAFRNSCLPSENPSQWKDAKYCRPASVEEWLCAVLELCLGASNDPFSTTVKQNLAAAGVQHVWQLHRLERLSAIEWMHIGLTAPSVAICVDACRAIEYDELDAVRAFDDEHQSIVNALDSGFLPRSYFERPMPKAEDHAPTIVQLLPLETTTYFLVGDMFDNRYVNSTRPPTSADDGVDVMQPMQSWVHEPAMVRRVACYALMERTCQSDGRSKRWIEPVLHLATTDQETMMNQHNAGTIHRHTALKDPTHIASGLSGSGERTLPASCFIDVLFSSPSMLNARVRKSELWTHLLVSPISPPECGFSRASAG